MESSKIFNENYVDNSILMSSKINQGIWNLLNIQYTICLTIEHIPVMLVLIAASYLSIRKVGGFVTTTLTVTGAHDVNLSSDAQTKNTYTDGGGKVSFNDTNPVSVST